MQCQIPPSRNALMTKKAKATAVTNGILTDHAVNLLQSAGICMCATSVVKTIGQGSAHLQFQSFQGATNNLAGTLVHLCTAIY